MCKSTFSAVPVVLTFNSSYFLSVENSKKCLFPFATFFFLKRCQLCLRKKLNPRMLGLLSVKEFDGVEPIIAIFSMENERVERLSQRVEQWLATLSHSEMIMGSNADWSFSVWRLHVPPLSAWCYLWIRQLPPPCISKDIPGLWLG